MNKMNESITMDCELYEEYFMQRNVNSLLGRFYSAISYNVLGPRGLGERWVNLMGIGRSDLFSG